MNIDAGFNGFERSDGLVVMIGPHSTWEVHAASPSHAIVRRCPCCDRRFNSARDAKAIAARVFRLRGTPSAAGVVESSLRLVGAAS